MVLFALDQVPERLDRMSQTAQNLVQQVGYRALCRASPRACQTVTSSDDRTPGHRRSSFASAWAARRDPLARQHLLQAFQEGADFHTPLSSSDLNDDLFAVPGDCLAGVVIREMTGVKDAEEWLHAFLRAHELHQALPLLGKRWQAALLMNVSTQ
jgi:hypothetical protein